MITKEQCIKYLIKMDLKDKSQEEKLNGKGLATLYQLNSDKELKKITMADVLDYIHYLEEKNNVN